ncbi:MAG: hypothetical protein GY868_05555, partial [Deltaproteobacteria bacterium]|nr:hypothetical protein [Deltaproteobacteria bacterium]
LIGFPAQGLRPGNLFFLQAGKRSGLLQWDAARRSIIYYGSSNGTLPQHVLDFVECLLNVVDTFLNEIDACGDDQFCYLGPLIEMTVDIPLCILDIF